MPPFLRALLEAFLDDAGVFLVHVDSDGRIWESADGEQYEQLRDPAFVIQAAVQADLALEALIGKRGAFGEETIERLANLAGIEDTEGFYQERCRILHETVTPEVLEDALKRARPMIVDGGWRTNHAGR
jgi:hypothetical protein